MKKFPFIRIIIIVITFMSSSFAKYETNFFNLNIKSLNGEIISLSQYKDKATLIVNVASNCGFTKQYADLQNLWDRYKDEGLIILGVPSNQFGKQEPGTNSEIKKFCEVNFNITFPMTDKVDVRGKNAHPIYLWAKESFGKSAVPKWNFHKILINKDGEIQDTFSSLTKPSSKKITNQIEKILNID